MANFKYEVFPISLFWFSWTTYKSVHYIVPIIASAFWGWSFYTLILMTYTYTEDSYKVSLYINCISRLLIYSADLQRFCPCRSRPHPECCRWRLSAVCRTNVHERGLPMGWQHIGVLSPTFDTHSVHFGEVWTCTKTEKPMGKAAHG